MDKGVNIFVQHAQEFELKVHSIKFIRNVPFANIKQLFKTPHQGFELWPSIGFCRGQFNKQLDKFDMRSDAFLNFLIV